jgi:hypothetical protein
LIATESFPKPAGKIAGGFFVLEDRRGFHGFPQIESVLIREIRVEEFFV